MILRNHKTTQVIYEVGFMKILLRERAKMNEIWNEGAVFCNHFIRLQNTSDRMALHAELKPGTRLFKLSWWNNSTPSLDITKTTSETIIIDRAVQYQSL